MRRIRDLSRLPVMVAPMAGGVSTPELVIAASQAGAFGWLAGGYKTADAMVAEMTKVRSATDAPFGVNVFVPGTPRRDRDALVSYIAEIAPDAHALRSMLTAARWDDDDWSAKVNALVARPPAAVSFTFGCPPRAVVSSLQSRGVVVIVTVTTVKEAEIAI